MGFLLIARRTLLAVRESWAIHDMSYACPLSSLHVALSSRVLEWKNSSEIYNDSGKQTF
jgi:hypothetical protein